MSICLQTNSPYVPYIGFKVDNNTIYKGKNTIFNYRVNHDGDKTTVTFNYGIKDGDGSSQGTQVLYK